MARTGIREAGRSLAPLKDGFARDDTVHCSTILKMIFNFKVKDMPPAPSPSIRPLTTTRDFNHMVEMPD